MQHYKQTNLWSENHGREASPNDSIAKSMKQQIAEDHLNGVEEKLSFPGVLVVALI